MLAVYAHPDDPEISAGGTLARWADARRRGARRWSRRAATRAPTIPTPTSTRSRALRVEETAAAARVLGLAGTHHLDHPDGELADDRALRRELVRVVRDASGPTSCCAPTRPRCSSATATSTTATTASPAGRRSTRSRPRPGNPHYFPELRAEGLDVHRSRAVYLSGTLEPNVWVDIRDTLERKIEALFCHASQLVETGDWFREFLRDSAEAAGRAAGVTYAEALPPDQLV